MRYALFLGCTIPARSRNYELAARKVAGALEIDLVDEERFICCGFPVRSADRRSALVLGAYNLALARERGLDVCTLCSSCSSALTETAHLLAEDETLRGEVNKTLAKAGLVYEGRVRVRHFARVLYEEVGLEELKRHVTRPLKGLRVASHYGCHYLKPSAIYDGFDDPEVPVTLDRLVALTGAEVVDYARKSRCCGGPVLPVDERTALSVAGEKLKDIRASGANVMNLVCPFCAVMYDSNQKSIVQEAGEDYSLPVLYLPQILGMAMGFERKELGLNLNVVKTKGLSELLTG